MDVNVKMEIKNLDQLTEVLAFLASALSVQNGMKNTEKAIQEIQDGFKEATEEEAKTAESLFDKDWPTLEEVREKFVAKNSKENREKLKALLNEYGSDNISDLKEIYYKDILKDLGKI